MKLILVLSCFLMTKTISSQETWKDYNLKGKVKKVSYFSENKELKQVRTFDNKGNVIGLTNFLLNKEWTKWSYLLKKNTIQETVTNKEGKVIYFTEFQYNKSGRLIMKKYSDNSIPNEKKINWSFKYNQKGQLIECKEVISWIGQSTILEKYKYKGNKLTNYYHYFGNELGMEKYYKYNQNKIVETIIYHIPINKYKSYVSSSETPIPASRVITYNNGNKSEVLHSYTNTGKIKETIYDSLNKTVYTYNSKDDLIRVVRIENRKRIVQQKYNYQYDNYKNIVRKSLWDYRSERTEIDLIEYEYF